MTYDNSKTRGPEETAPTCSNCGEAEATMAEGLCAPCWEELHPTDSLATDSPATDIADAFARELGGEWVVTETSWHRRDQ